MDRVEEQKLLKQAQRGNAEAFSALYRAHVQTVFRYIYHRVNNVQLAEDLTGDVFTRALTGLASYQDMGKPFLAWLYSIAHARVVDYYRRAGRQSDESDEVIERIPVSHDMDEGILRRQAVKALREAITSLTGEQQQVVILRFIEGYRIEQVAEIMGKNANAIKALQHRALRSLASRLERTGLDMDAILSGLL
ncbi:MAG: sigma-70 family RNA polymerase sigma factor [Anaerolineae bacterium]